MFQFCFVYVIRRILNCLWVGNNDDTEQFVVNQRRTRSLDFLPSQNEILNSHFTQRNSSVLPGVLSRDSKYPSDIVISHQNVPSQSHELCGVSNKKKLGHFINLIYIVHPPVRQGTYVPPLNKAIEAPRDLKEGRGGSYNADALINQTRESESSLRTRGAVSKINETCVRYAACYVPRASS